MHSELDRLRRRPDLEAPGLVAVDAADRLILDRSATARENAEAATVGVIGDAYGALTLGAALAGATGIRVHQDALTGERALAANADDLARALRAGVMVAEDYRDRGLIVAACLACQGLRRTIGSAVAQHRTLAHA